MLEQVIQSKLTDHIIELGGYVVKVIRASKTGVPDLLCCIDGQFIAIEVKRPETKEDTSPLQKLNLQWIKEARGIAGVAWDIESLEELLNVDL